MIFSVGFVKWGLRNRVRFTGFDLLNHVCWVGFLVWVYWEGEGGGLLGVFVAGWLDMFGLLDGVCLLGLLAQVCWVRFSW